MIVRNSNEMNERYFFIIFFILVVWFMILISLPVIISLSEENKAGDDNVGDWGFSFHENECD